MAETKELAQKAHEALVELKFDELVQLGVVKLELERFDDDQTVAIIKNTDSLSSEQKTALTEEVARVGFWILTGSILCPCCGIWYTVCGLRGMSQASCEDPNQILVIKSELLTEYATASMTCNSN